MTAHETDTQRGQPGTEVGTQESADDFDALLKKEFRPRSAQAHQAVISAVQTLSDHALQDSKLTTQDASDTVESIIAELDKQISSQVNEIIHHKEFQALESAWRGLDYLVSNSQLDSELKIRALNVTKDEIFDTFTDFKGNKWDKSPLFQLLYEDQYGAFGGEPYGALIADYHFGLSSEDMTVMKGLSQIGAAAHAPVIAAAAPELLELDSWEELNSINDIATKFEASPAHAAWRAFRETEDSHYFGLTLPRFLAREPYGSKGQKVKAFGFEEDTGGGDLNKYSWANAAYAMGVNITRAFADYGWTSAIRGLTTGGKVEDLPARSFSTQEGELGLACPTEISISHRRESELAEAGFISLNHQRNTTNAVFFGVPSVHKAKEYSDIDATRNAKVACRIENLLPTCRIAHFLKTIIYTKIGSATSQEELQRDLQEWLIDIIVEGEATEKDKAQRPLSAGTVLVRKSDTNPGAFDAVFQLQTHERLEGVNVSLRLVAKKLQGAS